MEVYPKKTQEFLLAVVVVFSLMALTSTYLWAFARASMGSGSHESSSFLRAGLAWFLSSLVASLLLWRVRSAETVFRVCWRSLLAGCGAAFVYGLVSTWGVTLFQDSFMPFMAVLLVPIIAISVGVFLSFLLGPLGFFLWRRQQQPSCDRWFSLPLLALSFIVASLAPLMLAASWSSTEPGRITTFDFVMTSVRTSPEIAKQLLSEREMHYYLAILVLFLASVLLLVSVIHRFRLVRWMTRVTRGELSGWKAKPLQTTPEDVHLPIFSPQFGKPEAILLRLSAEAKAPYRESETQEPIALIPSTPIVQSRLQVFWLTLSIGLFIGGLILFLSSLDSWKQLPSPTTERLNAVWGLSPEMVFAVGDHGTILRSIDQGASWQELQSGTTKNLNKIWGSAKDDLYIVGDGILLHSYNSGSSWDEVNVPDRYRLSTLFGVSAREVYLGGESVLWVGNFQEGWRAVDYKKWRYKYQDNIADPTKLLWINANALSGEPYFYFLSTFQSQFKAFTREGVELESHRAGVTTMWMDKGDKLYTPNATVEKDGVWGGGGHNISSSLAFFSRFNWQGANAVWGDDQGAVIAVGANGFISKHTWPEDWEEQQSPTDQTLYGVWGDGTGRFYSVGDRGVIVTDFRRPE